MHLVFFVVFFSHKSLLSVYVHRSFSAMFTVNINYSDTLLNMCLLVFTSNTRGWVPQARVGQRSSYEDVLIQITSYITDLFIYLLILDWSVSATHFTTRAKSGHGKNFQSHPPANVPQRLLFIGESHFMWLYWVLKGSWLPPSFALNSIVCVSEWKTENWLYKNHGRDKQVTLCIIWK